MRKLSLLLFLFCFSLHVNAANTPPLQYLGIENGLSNNAVTCIFQDSHGFMWFGTFDGLNRYDGYSFKVFRNRLSDTSSLIHNWVTAINEDRAGNIWIGTKQGTVIYSNTSLAFSPLYFTAYRGKSKQKMLNATNSFETDIMGNIFIGTAGKGLLLNYQNNHIAVQIPYMSRHGLVTDYHVQAIKKDAFKKLWLFIQGEGIAYYDYKSRTVKLVDDRIRTGKCLQPDLAGNIWVGSESGLYRYNVAQKKTTIFTEAAGSVSGNTIVNMCLDKSGELWIATDGGGVDILKIASGEFRYLQPGPGKGSLTSSAVYAVYQDKDSRMWIGTLRGGINILDHNKNWFTTLSHDPLSRNSIVSNFIISFCEDKSGNIWIGTDGEGLSYWNRKANSFSNYVHNLNYYAGSLSNNNVVRIIKDYQDQIWIATYGGGINKINSKNNSFIQYTCYNSAFGYEDRNVWSLYEDSRKDLWAGTLTEGGLYRLNRRSDKFELFDKDLKNVLTLSEDKNGDLWAGTFTQLIRIDLKNKKHKIYNIGFAVRAILEDEKKNFWIGTEGGGLLNFNRQTGTSIRFAETEGLPGNAVLNLLEDKQGDLWISTFNGLSKFNIQSKKFKNFYESDGLQSNQFNYNAALALSTGEFLFGGIKGFNIFYPKKIKPNINSSDVLLTGLRINNIPFEKDRALTREQDVYTIKKITLPYDKAVLSVDFVTPEYSAPDKVRYAYYLEGWDKDWNYSGTIRTANYSRLQEGYYKLRIKSTNTEGIWSNSERVVSITILPPWWRSWWAYLLYSIMAAGSVYAYILYQKRQAHLKYEIKLANLKVEQEKELNEKKLTFFTHIAHEFRTPLTLIINPVKEILYSKGKMIDNGELSIVYRNSRRLLSLVDQLLLFRKADSNEDNLKIVKLNFVDLCKEVFLCFRQQAGAKNIRYEFNCEDDALELYADREKIEIILFNLITNALKFTPEGGKVSVSISNKTEHLMISVSDTGCGIPEETGNALFNRFYRVRENNQKSGFGIGLYLAKKFAEAHHGTITYTSQKGQGTDFLLTLLTGKDHFRSSYIFEDVAETSVFLEELIEDNSQDEIKENSVNNNQQTLDNLVSDQPVMVVVDDNIQIRQYIRQIFNEGYIVYDAENGEDGFLLIKKYQPDIVISDVVMTGITGIELCSRIKEDPSLNHIPFILLTASSSAEIKLKGIEGGADDYITKPFEKDLLVARVAGILKSRSNLQKYFYNEVTLRTNDYQISSEYSDFLNKCIKIIERHLDDPDFNIKIFAAEIGMSHSNLYKKVKSISGRSVNEFMRFIRLRKAAEILINSDCNVNEAAFSAGFNDIKYFREQFFKLFEMKPSQYIKKYRKTLNRNFKVNDRLVR